MNLRSRDQSNVNQSYKIMNLILFWTALMVLSSLYVTVPLTVVFADDFHISLEHAALAGSAFSVFFAVGCLIYGPLSDRLGRKNVIATGLLLLSAVTLAIGLTDNFTIILLLRCLQGATAATFSPTALIYAGEMFPPQKRVTAIGFISTGFLMAGITGQVWSSFISEHWGWHYIFLLLACIYLLTAFVIIFFLPSSPAKQQTGNLFDSFKQFGTIIRNRSLVLSYGITITLLLCFVGMYTALGSLLSAPPFELNTQQIVWMRAIGITGMVLSPIAGRLCRSLGKLRVLRVGLATAGLGLILMCFAKQLIPYAVMSVVFVAGISLVVPSIISLIGELGDNLERSQPLSTHSYCLSEPA